MLALPFHMMPHTALSHLFVPEFKINVLTVFVIYLVHYLLQLFIKNSYLPYFPSKVYEIAFIYAFFEYILLVIAS
jgi:hypothetical protein